MSTRLTFIEKRIEQLQTELDNILRFGEDDWPNGTILYFEKRFNSGGRLYSYTALKCEVKNYNLEGKVWYTSGPKAPGPYTWEQLSEFMSQGVDKVWVVTTLEEAF